MASALELVKYVLMFIYGVFISVSLVGGFRSRGEEWATWIFSICVLLAQAMELVLVGLERTMWLYPL